MKRALSLRLFPSEEPVERGTFLVIGPTLQLVPQPQEDTFNARKRFLLNHRGREYDHRQDQPTHVGSPWCLLDWVFRISLFLAVLFLGSHLLRVTPSS